MTSMSRRNFMKVAGWAAAVTGFSAVAVPIVAYFYPAKLEEVPSEPVAVGKPEDLPVWGAKVIPFGRYPALVIHTPEGLRAYSAVCTHFACICKWNAETKRIECPCHDGFFDPADGSVISGPPPRGLDVIVVRTGDDGQIYIGGEEA